MRSFTPGKHYTFLLVALSFLLLGSCGHLSTERAKCESDLRFLPNYLLTNDAGGKDHWARHGEPHLERAMKHALSRLNGVSTTNDCREILQEYLRAWRHGHLWVQPTPGPAALDSGATNAAPASNPLPPSKAPTVRRLTPSTSLLAFPSFYAHLATAIDSLLTETSYLSQTPNWIIDLRANDGGSDLSWYPLHWRISGAWVSVEELKMLATPDNVKGWEGICDNVGIADQQCKLSTLEIAATLAKAEPGSYVSMSIPGMARGEIDVRDQIAKLIGRPSRVAILIDRECGSSCEAFLLWAKQSSKVKLIGRPTAGMLDYSNMISKDLPSGQLKLFYAATRSNRLPLFPVDSSGIQPDIFLELPKDPLERDAEVAFARRYLEEGQ